MNYPSVAALSASFSSYRYFFSSISFSLRVLHSFPTRRSSDLSPADDVDDDTVKRGALEDVHLHLQDCAGAIDVARSEEHTSELQSRFDLVCRLLLEKKNRLAVVVSFLGTTVDFFHLLLTYLRL